MASTEDKETTGYKSEPIALRSEVEAREPTEVETPEAFSTSRGLGEMTYHARGNKKFRMNDVSVHICYNCNKTGRCVAPSKK